MHCVNKWAYEVDDELDEDAALALAPSASSGTLKHFLQRVTSEGSGRRKSKAPMPLRDGTLYPHAVAAGSGSSSANIANVGRPCVLPWANLIRDSPATGLRRFRRLAPASEAKNTSFVGGGNGPLAVAAS